MPYDYYVLHTVYIIYDGNVWMYTGVYPMYVYRKVTGMRWMQVLRAINDLRQLYYECWRCGYIHVHYKPGKVYPGLSPRFAYINVCRWCLFLVTPQYINNDKATITLYSPSIRYNIGVFFDVCSQYTYVRCQALS